MRSFFVKLEMNDGMYTVRFGNEWFQSFSAAECIEWAKEKKCR